MRTTTSERVLENKSGPEDGTVLKYYHCSFDMQTATDGEEWVEVILIRIHASGCPIVPGCDRRRRCVSLSSKDLHILVSIPHVAVLEKVPSRQFNVPLDVSDLYHEERMKGECATLNQKLERLTVKRRERL